MGILGAVLLGALILLPAVHTTFRFDDSVMYELRSGVLQADGRTVGEYVGDEVGKLFSTGRAHPLGIVLVAVPLALSDHPVAYKWYLIATALLAALLLFAVVRRLGIPKPAALAGVALFTGLVQFRFYHDGLLGYSGLVQWSVVLLALALLAWLAYERGGGRQRLITSVVLWTACLLLYDGNLPFLAVMVAVVAVSRKTWRGFGRGVAVFAVPAFVAALAEVVLRATGSEAIQGYSPAFSLGRVVRTYAAIVVGSVPGSYALWDPDGLMGDWSGVELLAGLWRGAAVAAVVGLVVWRTSLTAMPRRALASAALLGLALWLTPGALLSLAPKYQDELLMGKTYITAPAGTLGVSVLVLCGSLALVSWARRRGSAPGVAVAALALVCAVVGAAVAFTWTANLRVVAIEQAMTRTRSLLHGALRTGVLRGLPEDATVVALNRDLNWYPYNYTANTKWFGGVTLHRTGVRYDMRVDQGFEAPACERTSAWPHRRCEPPAAVGGWLAVRPYDGGGAAIFAASPDGQVGDPMAPAVLLRVFAEGRSARRPVVTGTMPDGTPWTSEGTVSWQVVGRGSGGILFEGVPESRPAVSTVNVPYPSVDLVDPDPPPVRARTLGQGRLLP